MARKKCDYGITQIFFNPKGSSKQKNQVLQKTESVYQQTNLKRNSEKFKGKHNEEENYGIWKKTPDKVSEYKKKFQERTDQMKT